MTNTYMEFPYSHRSLEARLWSKKHQFDKVRMEYICVNPTKKYSNFPISLQIKTSNCLLNTKQTQEARKGRVMPHNH